MFICIIFWVPEFVLKCCYALYEMRASSSVSAVQNKPKYVRNIIYKAWKFIHMHGLLVSHLSLRSTENVPLRKRNRCIDCEVVQRQKQSHVQTTLHSRGEKCIHVGGEKERKKICCKAIKYNSSCRGPCEERVIAMTHWCNPFKTLWLGPRLLSLPLQACVIIFISDTIHWLPLQLAGMCKLPCRPPAQAAGRASCPGCVTRLARAWKGKKKKTHTES